VANPQSRIGAVGEGKAMSEAIPVPPADDWYNVFMTAFLGAGVIMTVQAQEDIVAAQESQ
jgi:hypothetical protein